MEFEFEKRLIEEVKKYECLYNVSHPDYKKHEKEAIWDEVAQALHCTPQLTKRKWRNIRDYFYQIKRAEKSLSGSTLAKRKKWKHFERCSFLNDVSKNRPYENTRAHLVNNLPPIRCRKLDNMPSESDETPPSPQTQSENEAEFTFQSVPSRSAEQEQTDEFREFLQCATDSIRSTCETMQAVVNNNNNNLTLFFNSLASDITDAELSPIDIVEIKMKISSIVYDKIASKCI